MKTRIIIAAVLMAISTSVFAETIIVSRYELTAMTESVYPDGTKSYSVTYRGETISVSEEVYFTLLYTDQDVRIN